MTAKKFLKGHVRLDGKPVPNVVQVHMDAAQTTLVYDVENADGRKFRRAVTVETEAITIE